MGQEHSLQVCAAALYLIRAPTVMQQPQTSSFCIADLADVLADAHASFYYRL
jgi:hypothetical protein